MLSHPANPAFVAILYCEAIKMAPALGFEPRTKWLTATYSTAELCRSVNVSNIPRCFEIFKLIFENFLNFLQKSPFFELFFLIQ